MISRVSINTTSGIGPKKSQGLTSNDTDPKCDLAAMFFVPLAIPPEKGNDGGKSKDPDPSGPEKPVVGTNTDLTEPGARTIPSFLQKLTSAPSIDTTRGSTRIQFDPVPESLTSNAGTLPQTSTLTKLISQIAATGKAVIPKTFTVNAGGKTTELPPPAGDVAKIVSGQRPAAEFRQIRSESGALTGGLDPKEAAGQTLKPGDRVSAETLPGSAAVSYETDAVPQQKVADQIQQIASIQSGQDIEPVKLETSSKGNNADSQADPNTAFVNNFLTAATKRSVNFEIPTPPLDLSRAVFDQVEPRLIGLAGLADTGVGKRILKMRLNPAELGAVEITLEKNSSGSISAHFQTESEKTREILGQSLVQLRTSLENSGWQVGDLNISCNASLSNGGDTQGSGSQSFGRAEQHAAPGAVSDGDPIGEGGKEDRLVNLRA